MNQKERNEILKRSKSKKAIYIDCFDTLVHRKYSHQYVFYQLTRLLKTNYPFPLSFSSLYLALSQSFFSRCDRPFEETAQDVYWHYQEYIPESKESFVARLKQTFIQAECKNIEIDPIAV